MNNDDTARLDWLNTVQGMDWFADCDYSDATRDAIDAARGVQPAAQERPCSAHQQYDQCCPFCRSGVSLGPAAQEGAPAAEQLRQFVNLWHSRFATHDTMQPVMDAYYRLYDSGVLAAPSPAQEKPDISGIVGEACVKIARHRGEDISHYTINDCGAATEAIEKALAAQEKPPQIKCDGLHGDTLNLVIRFAQALADKLKAAQEKYGYFGGWWESDWREDCQQELLRHLAKGDPRDVANYCAFMWHHGWPTVAAQEKPMKCPHCGSGLLWSEDRRAHCDGCDDYNAQEKPETSVEETLRAARSTLELFVERPHKPNLPSGQSLLRKTIARIDAALATASPEEKE